MRKSEEGYQGLTLEEAIRLLDLGAMFGFELHKMNDMSNSYNPEALDGLFQEMSKPKYHAIFKRYLQKVSLISWTGNVLEEYMERYGFKVLKGEQ